LFSALPRRKPAVRPSETFGDEALALLMLARRASDADGAGAAAEAERSAP